jgi:hypothetical protein
MVVLKFFNGKVWKLKSREKKIIKKGKHYWKVVFGQQITSHMPFKKVWGLSIQCAALVSSTFLKVLFIFIKLQNYP